MATAPKLATGRSMRYSKSSEQTLSAAAGPRARPGGRLAIAVLPFPTLWIQLRSGIVAINRPEAPRAQLLGHLMTVNRRGGRGAARQSLCCQRRVAGSHRAFGSKRSTALWHLEQRGKRLGDAVTVRLREHPTAGCDGFRTAVLVLPLLVRRTHHRALRRRIDWFGAEQTRKCHSHR